MGPVMEAALRLMRLIRSERWVDREVVESGLPMDSGQRVSVVLSAHRVSLHASELMELLGAAQSVLMPGARQTLAN